MATHFYPYDPNIIYSQPHQRGTRYEQKIHSYLKRPVTYHLLPEIITTVIRSAQKNLAIFKALN